MRTRGGRAVLPSSWITVAFWIVAIVSGLRPSPAKSPSPADGGSQAGRFNKYFNYSGLEVDDQLVFGRRLKCEHFKPIFYSSTLGA